MVDLTKREARHFRDELKEARASVLKDAEAYARPLNALERLARYLDPSVWSLGRAHSVLCDLADVSSLSGSVSDRWPHFHRPFGGLLRSVTHARNDVMHVGARARHLTAHAVEVCLVLEDALQQRLNTVGDFMVTSPVTVERWQPVSLVRQKMLEHSFTFLPVVPEGSGDSWTLLADHQLARFLRPGDDRERRERLAMPLGEAIDSGGLRVTHADCFEPSTPVDQVIGSLGDHPALVLSGDRLVGIVTAFDLL